MAKKITEVMFCEFSQSELEQKGQEMSTAMIKYNEVESNKKAVTAEYSEEMKGLRGTMRDLALAIRKKGENRPVDCKVVFNRPCVGTKQTI